MTDDAAQLYRQWWSVLPSFLGAVTPSFGAGRMAKPLDADAEATAAADPAGLLGQALGMTEDALAAMTRAWMPLVEAGRPPADALRSIVAAQRLGIDTARRAVAEAGGLQRALELIDIFWPAWAKPLASADGPFTLLAANPLQTGVDRAFGALADSFGLGAAREVLDNTRGLAEAEVERRRAAAEYLGIVAAALDAALQRALAQLEAMGERGEALDSLLGLLRLWVRALDQAMHEAMQSGPGIAATARLVRASTHRRLRLQRLGALAADALGLPTRADVGEAYREIQALKREVRRLRKGSGEAPADGADRPQAAKRTRAPVKRAAPRAKKRSPQ